MKHVLAGLMLAVIAAGTVVAQDRGPTPAPEPMRERHMFREGRTEFHHFRGPGMPGMGAWWKNSDVAKELNLSDAQKNQLEKTFLDYRMKLVDLNADVERQELKLEPLISADSLDENAVSSQLDQVIAARGRLEKTNAMMGVAMRKVLSQDQWKKLQTLHRSRVGPRAPWGPPRGPMPPEGPGPTPNAPKAAPAPPGGAGPSEL